MPCGPGHLGSPEEGSPPMTSLHPEQRRREAAFPRGSISTRMFSSDLVASHLKMTQREGIIIKFLFAFYLQISKLN